MPGGCLQIEVDRVPMLLIPYATDAPLYHRPSGTIGLILANTAVFVAIAGGVIADPSGWVLVYGEGLHPLQWISSSFLHLDLGHLLGNMAFLWCFGMIVEGKLGWRRFLPLYLGLTVAQNVVEQLIFLGMSGEWAYGASGTIFGLMVISVLWAPENDIRIFYWIFIRVGTLTLTVRTMGILFLVMNVVFAALSLSAGAGVSSDLLHLIGAAVGLPVGLVFLKRGWVDCEGWDLFSVRKGRHREQAFAASRRTGPEALAAFEEVEGAAGEHRRVSLKMVREHLDGGDALMAHTVYRSTVEDTGAWPLDEVDLKALITGLHRAQAWGESVSLMEDYIKRYPARAVPMRLKLAGILLEKERCPARALEVLQSVPVDRLTDAHRQYGQKIIQAAEKMLANPGH